METDRTLLLHLLVQDLPGDILELTSNVLESSSQVCSFLELDLVRYGEVAESFLVGADPRTATSRTRAHIDAAKLREL